MARGRKPLPQELLDLRGTARKDRLRPASVTGEKITVDDIGKCQVSGLKSAPRRARDIYWRVVRKAAALGILEESFLAQLFFYAVQYDHFLTCSEDIRKRGHIVSGKNKDGDEIWFPNPSVKQRDKALELLLKIGSNFGFSPVDKQRIRIQTEDPKEKKLKALFAMVYEDNDDGQVDDQ